MTATSTSLASAIDPIALSSAFEKATPQEVIQWAVGQFGDQMVMSSSFGEQATVLLHMTTQFAPNVRIIFVDTGYLFPETYAFMEQLRHRFNLNVWTFRTANDPIAYLHRAHEENFQWRNDVKACCGANKNEPFERAFRQLRPQAWLRGIRRDQAKTRETADFVEWYGRYNCWAVSPLLNWTSRDVGAYMKEHDLPYHPLVEKGYLSIGCNPLSCTRNVLPGEDPRAGRWAGQDKAECGLNVADESLNSANL